MEKKGRSSLKELEGFADWLESLILLDEELWLKPIGEGKWSIREILTHIMFWDRYNMEEMLPNMAEGASLTFVDIETHNKKAEKYAKEYTSLQTLIADAAESRKKFVAMLEEKYEPSMTFFLDGQESGIEDFIGIFTHHDAHHKKQVDAFLKGKAGTV